MRMSQQSDARHGNIPLTLITGGRGAGKTAMLRHLLDTGHARGLVAVVQDVAALADASIPSVHREGDVVQWPSGALAIGTDDPTATLANLARLRHRPGHVVVEADSSTSTRRWAGYGYMPGYESDGTIAVMDACVEAYRVNPPLLDEPMYSQLRCADVIVLNKHDIAGRDNVATVQQALARVAPAARFLWSQHGRIAPSLLLGPAPGSVADGPVMSADWRPDFMPADRLAPQSLLGESCRTWQLVARQPIAVRDFRAWVGRLGAGILRASGIVCVDEDPTHRHEFQLIGSRWQLRRGAPWSEERPGTVLTVVGVSGRERTPRGRIGSAGSSSGAVTSALFGQVM